MNLKEEKKPGLSDLIYGLSQLKILLFQNFNGFKIFKVIHN